MQECGKQRDRENMEEREREGNSRGQNGGVIEEAERERERDQMIAWNERGIEGGGRGGDKENRDGRGSE